MLSIMFSGSVAQMALSRGNAAFGCFDEHNRPLNIHTGLGTIDDIGLAFRQSRG